MVSVVKSWDNTFSRSSTGFCDDVGRYFFVMLERMHAFVHVGFSADNIKILHARKIVLHFRINFFITVWMMCSSTPLKKEISAAAILITQLGPAVCWKERIEEFSVERGSSLTGTMVNLLVGISKTPPLIDTSIVSEMPGVLYALLAFGLTVKLY